MSRPWTRPPFPFQNISLSTSRPNAVAAPNGTTSDDRSQLPQTPQVDSSCMEGTRSSLSGLLSGLPTSGHSDDPMGEVERDDPGYHGDTESPPRFVDPRRGKKRSPTVRKVKTSQQKLLHSIVRNYLVFKSLLPQNDSDDSNNYVTEKPFPLPSLPASPDPAVVAAYLAFQHSGPEIENILIHWRAPMSHLWNAKAIQLLVQDFEVYVQDKQLVKLVEILGAKVNGGDIGKKLDGICGVQELIEHKLDARRSSLRAILRKVEVMSTTMSATEISAVLQTKAQEGECRARRQERKKLKFLRRDEIIEQAMLLPKNQEIAENAKKWRDIKIMFSHFEWPDMSTDESETEGTFSKAKTLRRVRKYWLNPTVSSVLHYVDSQYSPRKVSGALKRGSAPLVRIHVAKRVNRTDAPTPEMPLNFYGPEVLPMALEVLAPGPAVDIPVVPVIPSQDI